MSLLTQKDQTPEEKAKYILIQTRQHPSPSRSLSIKIPPSLPYLEYYDFSLPRPRGAKVTTGSLSLNSRRIGLFLQGCVAN